MRFVGSFVVPKARTNYADDYDFWISKGRGQGKFRNYNPWLTIRDVKSPVGCSRIWSQKFKRTIHTLSYGETLAFFILERQDDVVDVREQYPLDPANTRDICHEMGLQHPGVGGRDIVMTSDFLVTYSRNAQFSYKAIQIKDTRETLLEPRTNSKLQVEEKYWERKGVPYAIWLSSEFTPDLKANFKLLSGVRNTLTRLTDQDLRFISDLMMEITEAAPELPYSECSHLIELHGTQLSLSDCLRILVACKLWNFPLAQKKIVSSILRDFSPANSECVGKGCSCASSQEHQTDGDKHDSGK